MAERKHKIYLSDDGIRNFEDKTSRNFPPNTIYSRNKNDMLHLWSFQQAEIALTRKALVRISAFWNWFQTKLETVCLPTHNALQYVVRMRIILFKLRLQVVKNLSAFKIVVVEETLFCRPLCQLLTICYNSSFLRQMTSKIICTSAVAGAKISFALSLRKFSSLGILRNLNVLESALKHMEKKLGSVRGRQATIDALIGNEHYPIRCLNQ